MEASITLAACKKVCLVLKIQLQKLQKCVSKLIITLENKMERSNVIYNFYFILRF